MSELREIAVMHVARELARSSSDPSTWFNKTLEKMDEAREKINAMSNLEFLDLLGEIQNER